MVIPTPDKAVCILLNSTIEFSPIETPLSVQFLRSESKITILLNEISKQSLPELRH